MANQNFVTFEDVRQAAADLRASGIEPSIEKIRIKLGRGSPVTITKFWKRIREEEAGPAPEAPAELNPFEPGEALVAAIRDNAQTFALGVLRTLCADVNEKFRPVRERMEQEKAEQSAAFDALVGDAQTARETAQALQADLDIAKGEVVVAQFTIKNKDEQIGELMRALDAGRIALDEQRQQIEALRVELAETRGALDAHRQAHAEAVAEAAAATKTLTAERDQALADWKKATDDAGQMRQQIGGLTADLDEARKQLAAAAEQQARATAELDTARNHAAELRGQLAAAAAKPKAPPRAAKPKAASPTPTAKKGKA